MDNSELLTIAQEYGTPTFVFDVEEFWRRLIRSPIYSTTRCASALR